VPASNKLCVLHSKNTQHGLQCFHIEDATFTNTPHFYSSIERCTVEVMSAETKCKALQAEHQ